MVRALRARRQPLSPSRSPTSGRAHVVTSPVFLRDVSIRAGPSGRCEAVSLSATPTGVAVLRRWLAMLPLLLPLAAAVPAGYNETYSYPDGIGGLIIEGPFPYKNGPSTWSDDNLWGAYGLLTAPGTAKDGKCSPIPEDSRFAKRALTPVPLTNGIKDCLMGCNLTHVKVTNGSMQDCIIRRSGACDQLVLRRWTCFRRWPRRLRLYALACLCRTCLSLMPFHALFRLPYGHSKFVAVSSLVQSADNCTAFHSQTEAGKLIPCTKEDIGKGACNIFCDPRTFPTASPSNHQTKAEHVSVRPPLPLQARSSWDLAMRPP